MTPREIFLNVLGWGVLEIIEPILVAAVLALAKALPMIWRKPPTKTTHIMKSPDK
ncbi:MAG: hypothetical protein ACTH30_14675 [Leucobacter sp.]